MNVKLFESGFNCVAKQHSSRCFTFAPTSYSFKIVETGAMIEFGTTRILMATDAVTVVIYIERCFAHGELLYSSRTIKSTVFVAVQPWLHSFAILPKSQASNSAGSRDWVCLRNSPAKNPWPGLRRQTKFSFPLRNHL